MRSADRTFDAGQADDPAPIRKDQRAGMIAIAAPLDAEAAKKAGGLAEKPALTLGWAGDEGQTSGDGPGAMHGFHG